LFKFKRKICYILGNKETVWTVPKITTPELNHELRKFFDTFYSAHLMRLVILGAEPIDDMQALVEQWFSSIPDKSLEMPESRFLPYNIQHLDEWIEIVPKKQARLLLLSFPVPSAILTLQTNVSSN